MFSEALVTSSVPIGLECCISSEPPGWYAVYTRSHFEKNVATALTEQGIENYLPVFSEVHEWKDRRRVVDVPVFPSYLFVRFADAPAARLRILRTNGVVRVLGLDMMAESVPDEQVEAIRRMLASSQRCYRQPAFREGVRVRVRRGPLQDLEGSLIRIKNQARLVVSINLLSQAIAMEIDVRDVEPVSGNLGAC